MNRQDADRLLAKVSAAKEEVRWTVAESEACIRHSMWLLHVTRPWWAADVADRIVSGDGRGRPRRRPLP